MIENVLSQVQKQESFFDTADHLRISQNLGEIEVLSNLYLKTPIQQNRDSSYTEKKNFIVQIDNKISHVYENRNLAKIISVQGTDCKKYEYKILPKTRVIENTIP